MNLGVRSSTASTGFEADADSEADVGWLAAPAVLSWPDLAVGTGEPSYLDVPFEHPLYVLYSIGTTGIPKAIVHGHGGILLEHLKMLHLQLDLRAGDRFFWFTTTGWMMWNYLVSGLVVGATVVLFDGNPTGPDPNRMWARALAARGPLDLALGGVQHVSGHLASDLAMKEIDCRSTSRVRARRGQWETVLAGTICGVPDGIRRRGSQ